MDGNTNNSDNAKTEEGKYSGSITTDFLGGIVTDKVEEINKINLSNRTVSLKEIREKLTFLTDMIYKQEDQITFQGYMGVERKLPKEVMHQTKGFFIPDFEYNKLIFGDYLREKSFGLVNDNGTPMFAGRFIYPVQGFNGEVLGYIGYDKDHITKYLLSRTSGFGKSNMFYGMHMMRWIYSQGYIVVVEGIVDAIYLWTLGIPAIALNGNSLTEFSTRVIRRFGYNTLFIPDNDEAGENAIKYWKTQVPEASVLKVTKGKDLDDWRKTNDIKVFFEALEEIKKGMMIKMPKTILI